MASSSSPTVEDNVTEYRKLAYHRIRTASVILPSGDRVRRKVSLASIDDETPFEDDDQTPLLSTNIAGVSGCSSITPSSISRDIPQDAVPWEPSRLDQFKTLLHSEGLKRYRATRLTDSPGF